MNKFTVDMSYLICGLTLAISTVSYGEQTALRNGQFSAVEPAKVWHQASKMSLSPEQFWLAYAEQNGGLVWGQRSDYPDYDKVKEHDLMIIVLPSGKCLMEFYHERWRRANDVWRWDKKFNDYGSCPDVFK